MDMTKFCGIPMLSSLVISVAYQFYIYECLTTSDIFKIILLDRKTKSLKNQNLNISIMYIKNNLNYLCCSTLWRRLRRPGRPGFSTCLTVVAPWTAQRTASLPHPGISPVWRTACSTHTSRRWRSHIQRLSG